MAMESAILRQKSPHKFSDTHQITLLAVLHILSNIFHNKTKKTTYFTTLNVCILVVEGRNFNNPLIYSYYLLVLPNIRIKLLLVYYGNGHFAA